MIELTIDPRVAITTWVAGESIDEYLVDEHARLRICELALSDGNHDIISELHEHLSDSEKELLNFRKKQINNDAVMAQEHLKIALESSRKSTNRDHLLEARIRMEWGLLRASLGESEEAGVDLKWAMERFKALSDGHPWHGLSCLNLAEWHRNRSEWGMALAIHGSMSRHGPHLIENVSLSRRRAAEIYIGINQMMNAMRNLWIAHHGFKESGLTEQAIDAGLHWLDLALTNVNDEYTRMDHIIEKATPRSHMEPVTDIETHPEDVHHMYTWINQNIFSRNGEERPDLHVLADAAEIIGEQLDLTGVEDEALLNRYQ